MEFRRVLFRSKRSPATESARRRRKRPIFLSMRLWYHAGTAVVPEFYGDLFHALYALGAEHDPQEKPPAHLVAPVLIENEVAERIVDVRVLVFLMLLHDMRMRADDYRGACVDERVREPLHPLRRRHVLIAPVRVDDRDSPLQRFAPHLRHGVVGLVARPIAPIYERERHAADGHARDPVGFHRVRVAEIADTHRIEPLPGLHQALAPQIHDVIIADIHHADAVTAQKRGGRDRKSTRLNSSHSSISYPAF